MNDFLNRQRPAFFCPGCAHAKVATALDKALQQLHLQPSEVVIVSDIGCAGLFDTLFATHAVHGLHGRSITYATGIKLANPSLTVIVVMGDGGVGIGSAHLLSACKKNVDLSLMVLNNFNYGMTGGQFSPTTPVDASANSGFLNQLEKPLDIGDLAVTAGAGFVVRKSAYHGDLATILAEGIRYNGFSVIDIWGVCTGRYTKRNQLTPKEIDAKLATFSSLQGKIDKNQREPYGVQYRRASRALPPFPSPLIVKPKYSPVVKERQEIMILGKAGQKIVTAGEILAVAGMFSGVYVTHSCDYPVTVLRGHSISEVTISPKPIEFTGSTKPKWILAVGQEGVDRKRDTLSTLEKDVVILKAKDVYDVPCIGRIYEYDFDHLKIKQSDRALALIASLAEMNLVITSDMLVSALKTCLSKKRFNASFSLVKRTRRR